MTILNYKTLVRFNVLFSAALVVVVALSSSAFAAEQDRVFEITVGETLQQLLTRELQTEKYTAQIARYNDIESAADVLPAGTRVKVPEPYLHQLNFARVVFVKGDVQHAAVDSVVNPPARGALIHSGDEIRTGPDGFVSLAFNSGASVNLQPESRVLISDINCVNVQQPCIISLDAKSGEVQSAVTPRGADDPPVKFSVDTPFLSAAVRGTAFYVSIDGAVNRVGVTKGLVAAASAGANYELPRGKGLSATGDAPAAEVELLVPPVINLPADDILLSAEDTLTWQPVDGAVAYNALFATDEAMAEVADTASVQQALLRTDLAAGNYYVAVAAVDAQSFEGLPAKTQVRIVDITETTKPELQIERRGEQVTLKLDGYDGPVQVLLSNSLESNTYEIKEFSSLAEGSTLTLPEDEDVVIRVRKLLTETAVSVYSDFYVLNGR